MITSFKKWFSKLMETTQTEEVYIIIKYSDKIITNRKYLKLYYIPGEIDDKLKDRIIEAAGREEYLVAMKSVLENKTISTIKVVRGEEVIMYQASEEEEKKFKFEKYDIIVLGIMPI
jgi:hypothetical protein